MTSNSSILTNRFVNRKCILTGIVICIGMILCTNPVLAADLYMSTTGTKTSGKSTAGDWSNSNCYNNLTTAIAAMSSGDVLTIDDGSYTGSSNTINGNMHPPSGPGTGADDARFTVIRARNIPCQDGYTCSTPLKVYLPNGLYAAQEGTRATYLKYWGIRFDEVNTYTGWNHLYFKQCAFVGVTDGNTNAASLDGTYNLIEDCVFYGKGRYKLTLYDDTGNNQAANNVCRRCVARQDWANANCSQADCSNPISTFVSYGNVGDAFLNCIDIDAGSPATFMKIDAGEYDGAFYAPKTIGGGMLVQGSIVLGNPFGVGGSTSDNNTSITYRDVAGVNVGGGIYHKGGGIVDRMTLYNVGTAQFSYGATNLADQAIAIGLGVGGYTHNVITTNSILKTLSSGTTAFSGATPSYINTYSVPTIGTTPTNQVTTDPSTHGLLYPVRIETDSSLATAGSSGGQIGARIVNKLGKDGTFKGDTDWNTEQGSLWPFPYEDWIKAQMASMPTTIGGSTMPSPTRGFASPTAKQLNGTDTVTLTSYIWESLGNPIPTDIYGASDTTGPVITNFTIPSTYTSLTVPITKFIATDAVGVTGYCLTESNSSTGCSWSTSVPTSYTFVSSGDKTLYAWAKDAAGNVSVSMSVNISLTVPDTTAPTITALVVPSSSNSLNVSNITVMASDNVSVAGYMLNESSTTPTSSDPGWVKTPPSSYSFTTTGNKKLYARAKDSAGNVSASVNASIVVSQPDLTAPVISSFIIPTAATSLNVAISVFSATDAVGVTGYFVSESTTTPAVKSTGWTTTAPASFTFSSAGTKTVYAWVKDAAGNVSAGARATVTITLSSGSTVSSGSTGNTYYLNPTGSDTNTCSQVQPCRQLAKALSLVTAGDTIFLADGTYSGVDATVAGTALAPITIKAQGSNAIISARANVRGNLYLNNCSYVIVDGIKTSGGTGSLAAGIAVRFSDHITVKNCTTYNNNMWGIFASNSPNLLLENNESYGQKTQHGIYVADATTSHDQPTIRGNRLHDNAKNGLHLNGDNGGVGWFTGALIENNVVYNNVGQGINLDGVQTSIIRNNVLYNNHGSGIALYQIDAAAGPTGNQVLNNTIDMASNSKWAIRYNMSSGTNTFRNNIFYSRNTAHGGISTDTSTDITNTDSDYNIFAGSTNAATLGDGNTLYTLTQWKSQGKDTHSITATPSTLFVSLGSNYQLSAASPALNIGTTLANVPTDIMGVSRPQGGIYDVGAYEKLHM